MFALEPNLRYRLYRVAAQNNKAQLIISGNTAQRGGGITQRYRYFGEEYQR